MVFLDSRFQIDKINNCTFKIKDLSKDVID